MAILTTYYDYELKKEAYKLTGEKGYVRNTSVLLSLVSVTETSKDYCTASFKVDVINDRAESQIVIYDNDVLIPFTYDNTEYTYLDWSNQITSEITIDVKLNYEVTHNLKAKYLGNLHCTQSKSKTVSVYRKTPETLSTNLTLSLNNSNRIYSYNAEPTVSATLAIVDSSLYPSANQNQTIKFYVDGVLNGSATTNSSGVASYSLQSTTKGYHTITAVYEGSEYLFNTESSTDYSKGYDIQIVSYPRYVLNDDDISVVAQMKDWFGNSVANKTLYLADSSHSSLGISATTNSDGKATLTMDSTKYLTIATHSNNVYSVPYTVRYSAGDYSDVVTTIDSQGMVIEIDDSTDYVSATNQKVVINGMVSPNITDLFPVTVNMISNGVSNTVETDNNGVFIYNYVGIGVGDTSITASINDSSDNVEIEDLLQYWRANNVSYNKKYYPISGEFRELTVGYKLEFPKIMTYGGVSVGLGEGTSFEHDFELSFDVVGSYNLTQMGVRQWKKGSSVSYAYVATHETVTNGDVIKAISEDGTLKVYKNDVEISSTTAYDYYPSIWIEGNKGAYLLFDNLKFKVI